jgi:hypothetical protein
MVFQSGNEVKILKCPFVLKKERVLKFVKLFSMFLTDLIHLFILMNFEICHNQRLEFSQEFTQFSVAEMVVMVFEKQIRPKPMTEIRVFFLEIFN